MKNLTKIYGAKVANAVAALMAATDVMKHQCIVEDLLQTLNRTDPKRHLCFGGIRVYNSVVCKGMYLTVVCHAARRLTNEYDYMFVKKGDEMVQDNIYIPILLITSQEGIGVLASELINSGYVTIKSEGHVSEYSRDEDIDFDDAEIVLHN